jgi:streptomycin 6-kinase
VELPVRLRETCVRDPAARAWLERLPALVDELARRWSLQLDAPFTNGTCAWVAPARRADGSTAVLKIGLPHFEALHEGQGLRTWNGDGAVSLLDADEERSALLLERCEPGSPLGELAEAEQDAVLAGLLRRLWRAPPPGHSFRSLSEMARQWCAETRARESDWADPGLNRAGMELFQRLADEPEPQVLLVTDLHAWNVLRAEREPWLAIDPKPFVGDRTYDGTQSLLNRGARMLLEPLDTIARFADALGVDRERLRLWTFARAAVASGRDPARRAALTLAGRLAP